MTALLSGCQSAGCNCNQCDGIYEPGIPHSPLAQARNWRKSLLCSGGCGEIYYGEWTNHPPDCCDPCDNAKQCTPPIVRRRGVLFGIFSGLYGKRIPRDCGDCDPCGCVDDCCCDDGGYVETYAGVNETPGCSSCASAGNMGGGCATCASGGVQYSGTSVRRAPLTKYSPSMVRQAPNRVRPIQSKSYSKTLRR
jgi:hypothetical protein